MTSRIILLFCSLFIGTNAFSQLESKKASNGKFGFTNDEQWAIQPIYDEVVEFYDYSYAFAKLNGKWGLIDQQGKAILPFEYSKVLDDEYLFGDEENKTIVKNLSLILNAVLFLLVGILFYLHFQSNKTATVAEAPMVFEKDSTSNAPVPQFHNLGASSGKIVFIDYV